MRKIILIIVGALLLFACTKEKKKVTKEKKPILEIQGKQIFQKNIEIQKIFVVDSLLIAKNHPSSKKLFSVFTKKEELLGSFGQIGQGPNDFDKYTSFFNQSFYNKKGNICIWLYERNYHRLRLINISKTIQNKTVAIEKEVNVPPNLNMKTVYYVTPELIVGNISNLDVNMDRLRFYNPILNKIEKRIPLFPKVKKDKKDITTIMYDYNYLFSNKLCFNSNKGFVCAMSIVDRIDFISMKGEITKTISDRKINEDREYNFSHFPARLNRTVYNYGITTSDNYILVVYNGVNSYSNMDMTNNIIKIYTWNGNEKIWIKPTEPLRRIAFDEANSILYGIDENFNLFKYELKDIFEKL